MVFYLLKMCTYCLILFSSQGKIVNKEITTEAYVNSIYSATHKAWPELEKVWDTDVYRKLRLIVADNHNAWAIDSKSLTKISYNEVQKRHLPVEYMFYKEIKWSDGRPTIYVSLGATLPPEEKARFQSEKNPVPMLFNVATHEAFHFFVQDKNISPDLRATYYPVQVTPRLYRNHIIRSLYAALRGDKNGLGHARYWFDLWRKKYPNDVSQINKNDIYEGSARYIEIAAEIMAQGESFNTTGFQHALIEKMKDDANDIYITSDSESYSIGALSGFILNMNNIRWQSKVEEGIPPLDILLKNIQPIKELADNKLEININQEINKINNKISTPIEDFGNAYNHPEVIKIFISSNLSGSYSVSEGFFHIKTVPYDLMVGLNSSAQWLGGSYNIKDSVAAVIDKSSDYGGKRGFLILYTGKLPLSKNGRLVLNTEKLSLNIPYPYNLEKTGVIHLF
ncbi:TPA: hypothetical protein ACS70C_003626 [Providencia alcalifaciens]